MLLSRVAESLYWINRYLERAENISRFVEVSEAMSLDCPPGSAEPWLPLIDASSDRETFDSRFPEKKQDDVINFLIRDRINPNSIISCITYPIQTISNRSWEIIIYGKILNNIINKNQIVDNDSCFSKSLCRG